MYRMKNLLLVTVLASFAAPAFAVDDIAPAEAERDAMRFFENEVRPLLAKRCYECHGEKKQKGGLRMDNISFIQQGGDSGPALIAGKPEESLLIEAIRYADSDFEMPPKEKLPEAEIKVLEKWVALGAPWPKAEATRVTVDEHGFTADDRALWSFQPLRDVQPPEADGEWARNEIDRFVAQKHAENGLTPAPEADRKELARRLYFDLHGLPPTPQEVQAFVNDSDPRAYEKLVDRLLASPRYGERWAQHWLDLVRYAESDGYREDAYRPEAWRYRDYVVQSLNADKPYDQFVREQLAGDEIDPENPNVLIGTSYLRNPIYEWNQRDVRGHWEVILTDITDTSGEVFLGLSFGCARCHDHKFDPILQKDYYRLRAFFAPVAWREDLKLATPDEKAQYEKQQQEWETATASIRDEMEQLIGKHREAKVRIAYNRFTEDLRAMADRSPQERQPEEAQLAYFVERQMQVERVRFDPAKSLKVKEEKDRYQALVEALKAFDHLKPKPLPMAFVATDIGRTAPPNVLKTRKGELDVEPGFLTLLQPETPPISPTANSTGRRKALAEWITRPDNQLSTRVIVNRVWHYHFGRGIVATPSDFGNLGEKPSHPELLDWLVKRFVANGWSLKKLHRDILLSATYRQTARRSVPEIASKIDPSNRLLWRFNPRRLDAEQVRDSMLAVSGELDLTEGGPSKDAAATTRRSIYTMKKRNSQDELLRSLDAPAGFSSTSERLSTTTPTQALLLLNSNWPLARAQRLASRISTVEEAWRAILGRDPSEREKRAAEEFIRRRIDALTAGGELTDGKQLSTAEFHPSSPQERLLVHQAVEEGDEFTIEAVFQLDRLDPGAAVRTIVSRWNLGKDAPENHGWSLGVTGEKSRYRPGSLIVQFVGENDTDNSGYEVVASDLPITPGKPYQVAVSVSCATRQVIFRVRDLSAPSEQMRIAVVPHGIRGRISAGRSAPVIGGLDKSSPGHTWDGRIDAVRVSSGLLPDEALLVDSTKWTSGQLLWIASKPFGKAFAWAETQAKNGGPQFEAKADLCHVLLNSNEFFYLH